MENEKVTNGATEEAKGIDFVEYSKDAEAPVKRGELAEILDSLMGLIGDSMDEVATPALTVVKSMTILINILKDKGLITHEDFVKAEQAYTQTLKEVTNNG